ncbi:Metal resistance protein YCF1 [Giardia duodenalis assemblage B]|uniref:Metal resistance protein YCF1 n=1 Tax=Giardia duodenalis assemblage B TaxID=1394984 RepID=A0A132NM72_GIAIN|nr:Metal resistance protein YCF1 [Giardia intestinalis assemblage B]
MVKMLCPYEKELQLADGRTAHMIAAALNNSALHAVFEEPKRKRARSRAQGSTRGR